MGVGIAYGQCHLINKGRDILVMEGYLNPSIYLIEKGQSKPIEIDRYPFKPYMHSVIKIKEWKFTDTDTFISFGGGMVMGVGKSLK